MKSFIEFSVIIPFFNAENTLAEAVFSVLSQTYMNFEIILIDNNSSDNSAAVARSLCERDERIKLIVEHKQGLSYALNAGISVASGKYIARMDADDIARNNWLETAAGYIARNPTVGFFSFDYIPVDQSGNLRMRVTHPTQHEILFALLLVCSPFSHPGAIILRRLVIENKYKNVKAEDHDLWCRLITKSSSGNTGEVGVFYRVSGNSLSSQNRKKIRNSVFINSLKLFVRAPLRSIRFMKMLNIQNMAHHHTLPMRRIVFLKRLLGSDFNG